MEFTWYTYAHTFVRASALLQKTFDLLDMEDDHDRMRMWQRTNHLIALLQRAGRENVKAPPSLFAKAYMWSLNRQYGLTNK